MNNLLIIYLIPVVILVLLCVLSLHQKTKDIIIGNLNPKIFYLSILGFSYFGLTVGVFVGLSSSSVLSAVLPALLTFIGGIMAYYFFNANNQSSDNQTLSMISLISISIYLSLGAYQGIEKRKIYEIAQKELEIDKEITLKKIDNELKKDILNFENELKINQPADTVSFDAIPKIKH